MTVATQAALLDVTQIFEGLLQIPLGNIRPNPNNPGPALTAQEIEDLAQNIAQAGLINPIKVQLDKTHPLADGVQPHPDNPRLRADGQPWTTGDFNWVILAGENRYRAFDNLKRANIPALVLNPTAKEAVKITHLDNEVRDRGWWAAYQSIEQFIQADPDMTQGDVAVELKMARPKVNRALQLLPLLNPEARVLISTNCTNSNKGNKGISESVAAQLAALGPGTGLKPGVRKEGEGSQKLWPYPAIPPETQDLVHRVLEVAIEHQMTEAGVRGLVAWVKAGNSPESFGQAKSRNQQPEIATSATAPIGAPPRNDSKGERPKQKPEVATSAQETDLHSQVGTAIASHELGKKLHLPAQVMNRLFPRLSRLFQWTRGLFEKAGVRNKFWATAITLFLLLWAAGMVVHFSERLISRALLNMAYSHLSTGPQTGGQALVVPSQGADGNGGTTGGSVQAPVAEKPKGVKHPKTASKPQPVQAAKISAAPATGAKTIPAWAQDEIPVAGDFTSHFYGISYSNWNDTLTYLKSQMTGTTTESMVERYFSPSLQKDMQTRMLAQYFSANQPPKVVSGEGDTAELLAQGTVNTVTRVGRNSQTLSTKPVALLMSFRHAEGIGSKIEKVTEVDPGTVGNKGQSADVGKQIGDGVKDLAHVVNTADDANSAVGKAKNLLGF